MLAKPDVEVVFEDGVAVGVSSEGETAKAKMVSCASSPSTTTAWPVACVSRMALRSNEANARCSRICACAE